jgi:hypothetical protein
MNITWKIIKLDCIPSQNGLNNIITNVYFEYIGEKTINGVTYTSQASEIMALEQHDVNDFTPLNEITKEQIISWIEPKVDTNRLNIHLNNAIEAQLKPQTIEMEPPFEN